MKVTMTVTIQRDTRLNDWWIFFEDGDSIRQSHLDEFSPLRRASSRQALEAALAADGYRVLPPAEFSIENERRPQ